MAHRLAHEAEADLDDIWYFIASESGSTDVADRFIESLAERFLLLARHPHVGRRRDGDLLPGLRSFRWAATSSCTASSPRVTS